MSSRRRPGPIRRGLSLLQDRRPLLQGTPVAMGPDLRQDDEPIALSGYSTPVVSRAEFNASLSGAAWIVVRVTSQRQAALRLLFLGRATVALAGFAVTATDSSATARSAECVSISR